MVQSFRTTPQLHWRKSGRTGIHGLFDHELARPKRKFSLMPLKDHPWRLGKVLKRRSSEVLTGSTTWLKHLSTHSIRMGFVQCQRWPNFWFQSKNGKVRCLAVWSVRIDSSPKSPKQILCRSSGDHASWRGNLLGRWWIQWLGKSSVEEKLTPPTTVDLQIVGKWQGHMNFDLFARYKTLSLIWAIWVLNTNQMSRPKRINTKGLWAWVKAWN